MEFIVRTSSLVLLKPRRKRLEGQGDDFDLDENGNLTFAHNDIENPKTWSRPRKWAITSISILLVINATFASSGPSAALTSLSDEFHVSEEAAGLTVTVFLITYAFGPLLWAPLSEHFGRRWIFYSTFLGYTAFNFLCAFAPNFSALLVGRFLTGVFASSTIANSPGLLVDVWDLIDRGNAMALFSMMVFCGPALGPVFSGFLQLKRDWSWVFYVLLWLAGATIPLLIMIPETLPSKILTLKARRIRRQKPDLEHLQAPAESSGQSLGRLLLTALTRPWRIFFDPISLACTAYTAFIYALLYMLFAIYPLVFRQKRGWNAGVSELPLLGIVIGSLIGGAFVAVQTQLDRKRAAAGHKHMPEDRLPLAMIGGILFPVSMFWFAWTAQYDSVPWIVPTIAGVFLAISFLFISVAYLNYLADCYAAYAASALAANSICRSLCGAATPLFTTYMFEALTVAGGGSLIAGLACVLAVVPFVFYWKGSEIRRRSKFASSIDSE